MIISKSYFFFGLVFVFSVIYFFFIHHPAVGFHEKNLLLSHFSSLSSQEKIIQKEQQRDEKGRVSAYASKKLSPPSKEDVLHLNALQKRNNGLLKNFTKNLSGFPEKSSSSLKNLNSWTQLNPTSSDFSILFPKSPIFSEMEKPVPNSNRMLHLKEFSIECEGEGKFSLIYTTLPQKWVRWGTARLILQGAVRELVKDYNASLSTKEKTFHQNFPAINYSLFCENKHVVGMFVLVKEVLYKIEVSHSSLDLAKELADVFFTSFQVRSTS